MKEFKFMVVILILILILPILFPPSNPTPRDEDCWWTFKGYSLCEYQKARQK